MLVKNAKQAFTNENKLITKGQQMYTKVFNLISSSSEKYRLKTQGNTTYCPE